MMNIIDAHNAVAVAYEGMIVAIEKKWAEKRQDDALIDEAQDTINDAIDLQRQMNRHAQIVEGQNKAADQATAAAQWVDDAIDKLISWESGENINACHAGAYIHRVAATVHGSDERWKVFLQELVEQARKYISSGDNFDNAKIFAQWCFEHKAELDLKNKGRWY